MDTQFAERLSTMLLRNNMTQKELAEKANVTQAAMSYYIRGERVPRHDVLIRISDALGTTTDYLLGKSDVIAPSRQYNYIQRNLQKMDAEELDKAEKILKAAFADIFDSKE